MELANIEISRAYQAGLPMIMTDGNQLKQVILNIINNAADAIHSAGTIAVEISRAGDRILVAISDTGIGMTPAQMERIFMPFFTTKEVGKGTGLGLSVSYSIIKSLDGKIEVSSELNKGSTFTISLPIR
jgi:two-component system NtrC family sensor kinase